MAVIELGVVDRDGDEPPAAAPRSPIGRRDLRRLLVALVTVCCLLAVTGSARPDPHGLSQLWSTDFQVGGGTFLLSADSVYLLAQPNGGRLTAYDLRTGAVRWSNDAPAGGSWLDDLEAGTLLLPTGPSTVVYEDTDGSTVTRDFNRDTVAVDAETGRRLWREQGELIATVGDRAMLTRWNVAGDKVTDFRTVRLRDGGTVWSRPATDVESWAVDLTPGGTIARLVTVTAKGRTQVLNPVDGTVVTTGALPWLPQSALKNVDTGLSLQGRQLYLEHHEGGLSKLTAYDTDTLRRLWSAEQPDGNGVAGCGPVLCLIGPDGTSGRDRGTGAVRWRLPDTPTGYPVRKGLLVVGDTQRRLIDAATGRQVADLGAAVPVWGSRPDGISYVVSQAERGTVDSMLISRLDERTGEMLLRGRIPAVLDAGCQSNGSIVVCSTPDNRLIVTDAG